MERAGQPERCAALRAEKARRRRTDEALDRRTAYGVAVEGAGVAHAEDEALLRGGCATGRRGLAVSAGAGTQRVARGWRSGCGPGGCACWQRDARRTDGRGGDHAGAACAGSARLWRPQQTRRVSSLALQVCSASTHRAARAAARQRSGSRRSAALRGADSAAHSAGAAGQRRADGAKRHSSRRRPQTRFHAVHCSRRCAGWTSNALGAPESGLR